MFFNSTTVAVLNHSSNVKNDFDFEGGTDYFEKYYKTLNDLV